ncbi:MAG: hypothetical protein BGO41_14915 [Clostridiales bacterium 38-18]|nr:MAG: hypothetical protein BGO41_14915 [Clostridiales bacterium 38-18]
MKIALIIVLLIANIPFYKFIKNQLFKDDNDFNEALNYLFIPNIISIFRGEYGKDLYGEFRIAFLFILSMAALAIEYFIFAGILSIFFN